MPESGTSLITPLASYKSAASPTAYNFQDKGRRRGNLWSKTTDSMAEEAATAGGVLDWLARRAQGEVTAARVLRAIRAAGGSVPLGGRQGGAGAGKAAGQAAGALQEPSAGFLLSAALADGASEEQCELELWRVAMACCALPVAVSPAEQEAALKAHVQDALGVAAIREAGADWRAAVGRVCAHYYAERRRFFEVRIALLRAALADSPGQIVDEVVGELLKEGLREALERELSGRAALTPPNFYAVAAQDVGQARLARDWELQVLEEEALLRELLLLVTYISQDAPPELDNAVGIATAVHTWDTEFVNAVLSQNVLALPEAQSKLRRITNLGVLLAIRAIHNASGSSQLGSHTANAMKWTRDFFLQELISPQRSEGSESPSAVSSPTAAPASSAIPGCLLLTWSSLLAHMYRQKTAHTSHADREIEEALQQCLLAAEHLHSFHFLHATLSDLVFGSDDMGIVGVPTNVGSLDWKAIWDLPKSSSISLHETNASNLSARGTRGKISSRGNGQRVTVFQLVGAEFLNDALMALAFMENLDSVQQLQAMVKLVLPVISTPSIAQGTLDPESSDNTLLSDGAMSYLLSKAKDQLPQSLLPYLRMHSALSANADGTSSVAILRYVLREWSEPITLDGEGTSAESRVHKQLPPDSYFRFVDRVTSDGRREVECTQTFLYQEDQLIIPVGTVGWVEDSPDLSEATVAWLLNSSYEFCVWDLVAAAVDQVVDGIQTSSFALVGQGKDFEAAIALFEWIAQVGCQRDGGRDLVMEIGRSWSEARLRRWWTSRHLPFPHKFLPLLVRHRVTLPTLLESSREDLVAWGIRDRYAREQVLAHIKNSQNSFQSPPAVESSNSPNFELDGLTHLIRRLLGFVDAFVHSPTPAVEGDDEAEYSRPAWNTHQLEFVTACYGALNTLLSSPRVIGVMMEELQGSCSDNCVRLIVNGAKKIFEHQERHTGKYPVLLATQEIFINTIRWLFELQAQDAGGLASSSSTFASSVWLGSQSGASIADAQKIWFVSCVEFVLEVLSTYESWKFASFHDRCETSARCFRLVYALLAGQNFTDSSNESCKMLGQFQTALRSKIMGDTSILMKLLRSTCGILSTETGHVKQWNSIAADISLDEDDSLVPRPLTAFRSTSEVSVDDGNQIYPLTFATDNYQPMDILEMESLVITCLRLIEHLIDRSEGSSGAAMRLLLTPIDDGGPKMNQSLTLVTLCGGYLGYSVARSPDVAYWSLKILQHTCEALDARNWGAVSATVGATSTSNHSLVAQFPDKRDLGFVRDALEALVRQSVDHMHVRKEFLIFLNVALEYQPGFLAFLLYGDESDSSVSGTSSKRFVGMIERFLVSSEAMLERSSDLFCVVLDFILQVWKGAVSDRNGLHHRISSTLKGSPTFWKNLTKVMYIQLPLTTDEHSPLNTMEWFSVDADRSLVTNEAYLGRSSAYGYLARGFVLQVMTLEWHYNLSQDQDKDQQKADGFIEVLDKFRTDDLYAQWLRAFTRFDYSQSDFNRAFAKIAPYQRSPKLVRAGIIGGPDVSGKTMSMYLDGIVCDVSVLSWHFGGEFGQSRAVNNMLKCAKWCNLQGAYIHAQLFALTHWKRFMEVLSLQSGRDKTESTGEESVSPSISAAPSTPSGTPVRRSFKRKESMIAAPPRGETDAPGSSSSRVSSSSLSTIDDSSSSLAPTSAMLASNFAGDRTSYGMIRVLADVLVARLDRAEAEAEMGDAALDYCMLVHISELVTLLASMLHHQFCRIIQKTRNPRFSQTQQRSDRGGTKMTIQKCHSLLVIIEKVLQCVDRSIRQHNNGMEVDGAEDAGDSALAMWKTLVVNVEERLGSLNVHMRTELAAAGILLIHHMTKIRSSTSSSPQQQRVPENSPSASLLVYVRLAHHSLGSLKLCDSLPHSPSTETLFNVNWGLFRELFDKISANAASGPQSKQKIVLDSGELWWSYVQGLEREHDGIGALFQMLGQWVRGKTGSDAGHQHRQACQVLNGLSAIVWNSENRDLCRRVIGSQSRLRLFRFFATEILPTVASNLDEESKQSGVRGYWKNQTVNADGEITKSDKLERSTMHSIWCSTVDFIAGLMRLENSRISANDDYLAGIWEFLSHAETQLLSSFHPPTRFTLALVIEHQSILRLMVALSSNEHRRKEWRQAFPRSCAILMEQSRQLLKRSSLLLGSSSAAASGKDQEAKKAGPRGSIASRRSSTAAPSSTSALIPFASLPYAHKTLLHEQIQPIEALDEHRLTAYYELVEAELVEIVRLSSLLLTSWTPSLVSADATVVVGGVRYLDDERLIPLLSFGPPSEAMTTNSELSLGHLCHSIDFLLSRLVDAPENLQWGNTINSSGLLFFKTLLLHAELYEHSTKDKNEFSNFFAKVDERLREHPVAGVDAELFELLTAVSRIK